MIIDALHHTKTHESYGYVHAGVWRSVETLRKQIEPVLKDALKHHSSIKRVMVTGHSLGAGCAALLAMELRDKVSADVRATVFAPPCVVSKQEAHDVDEFIVSFTCGDDCVPRVNAPRAVQLQRSMKFLIDKQVRDAPLARRLLQLWAVDPRVSNDSDGCTNEIQRTILKKVLLFLVFSKYFFKKFL